KPSTVITKLSPTRITAALEQSVISLCALLSDSEAKSILSTKDTAYGSSEFSVDIKNSNLNEEDFQLQDNINEFVQSILQLAKTFCHIIDKVKFFFFKKN